MPDAAIRLIVAAIALNALLTFVNVWPTPWVRPALAISFESAAIILSVALWVALVGAMRAGARITLAATVVLLVLLRYLDVTSAGLLGRPVDLYWEARHAPRLLAMGLDALSGWSVIAIGGGAIFAVVALGVGAYHLCNAIVRSVEHAPARRAAIAGAAVVLALHVVGAIYGDRPVSAPLVASVAHQLRAVVPSARAIGADDQTLAPPAISGSGGDVIVLFIESYGAVALDDRRLAPELADEMRAFADATAAAGWHVASARVEAPTAGGGSWLSHATLLSQQWIDGPAAYARYVERSPSGLTENFGRAGYRSVGVFPVIKRAWPECDAYGFDMIYDAEALSYRGPAFGWWTIPDQYSLDVLYRRELGAEDRAPVFAVYASLASHFPFTPVPPYLLDWDRVSYGGSFAAAPGADGAWSELDEGYAAAMRYNLGWLRGFLIERVDEDSVVVVLGDHQPPAIVAGPDVPWHTPVHVFSRNAEIPQALQADGFDHGLFPSSVPVGRMNAVCGHVVRALNAARQ